MTVRINQAVVLLAGALFLAFVVAPDDDRFYWTPLTIGLAFLSAAIAAGRESAYWAPACALTGWGAAVVLAGAARPDLDVSGLYLAGAGLGVAGGLLLQQVGYSGVPAAAGEADRAEPRARAVPVVQNTGPECFAGHAVAPKPAKDR